MNLPHRWYNFYPTRIRSAPMAIREKHRGGFGMKRLSVLLLCVAFSIPAVSPVFAADNDKRKAGFAAFTMGQYLKALELLSPFAELGDAKAQGVVGYMY